jgi:hypothetical protein
MYEHYKPLRNFTKKFHLEDSLLHVWHFMQNLNGKATLPQSFLHLKNCSVKGYVHGWELAILAREIILNAEDSTDKSLMKFDDFTRAINLVKKIAEEQSKLFVNDKNILHEMHRITQQQFPFQEKGFKIYRFLKIFKDADLDSIFKSATGLSIDKFYFLALSVAGSVIQRPFVNTYKDYLRYGITNEERDIFFSKVTTDVRNLKGSMRKFQEYNENWSYTFNPLLSTPLVLINSRPGIACCPIIDYFYSRISEGLIFDIFKRASGSEDIYGKAFENYVFDVSKRLITNEKILHLESQDYRIGKQLKHGADFCVTDNSLALLVECKAKRLNLGAKYKGDENSLGADLRMSAKFIVQDYKNLLDVKNNRTQWKLESVDLRPVVVSLMQYHIWTPEMKAKLQEFVIDGLIDSEIDPQIIQMHPYIVMSIEDYEASAHVINQVGLKIFFDTLDNSKYKDWSIKSVIRKEFDKEIKSFNSNHLHSALTDSFQKFNVEWADFPQKLKLSAGEISQKQH